MSFLRKVISLNQPMVWMSAFVVIFYLLIWGAGHVSDPHANVPLKIEQEKKASASMFKAREETFKQNFAQKPEAATWFTLAVFALILAGLVLDGVWLFRCSAGRPFFGAVGSCGPVPWGLKDVLHLFIFLFFIEAVIIMAEFFVGIFIDLKPLGKDFLLMLNSLLRDLGAAFFVLYWVKVKYGASLSEVGLTGRAWLKNIGRGLMGWIAILPVLLMVLIGISFFVQKIAYEPPPQAVVEIYLNESRKNNLLFFTVFVAVLGPMIEEIFFRGFTYTALRSKWGSPIAMLGSAAIFSALHFNFIATLPIFILGLFLAYLYEETGSLVPSMTVHVIHNLAMVGLTLGFKSLSAGASL